MASAFYRAVRHAARSGVLLLAAGNTAALSAVKALAAEHQPLRVVYRHGACVPVRA
ncbi:hypothetical protein ACIQ6K_26840 [Streptomyces sp. NPDC096354]|uniref:hypothetical protein n=1 Tax=Streptomyces sp. NPDC096354 TaxID=3366088 RepID=UPI0037FCF740